MGSMSERSTNWAMSIVRVDSTGTASKSSSVRITYLSFSYSYPFTISSYGTSSPSFEHTRWYLIRPWSFSCSWLNRRVFSSVAVYTRTGIDTRPKEMAPLHMVFMGLPPKVEGLDCTAVPADPGGCSTRSGLPFTHAQAARPGLHRGDPPPPPGRAGGGPLVDGG